MAAGNDAPGPADEPEKLPREVTSHRAFIAMGRAGLNYGPEFRCLENIHSSATAQMATATCANIRGDRARYCLHPVLIDSALQLLSAAATNGYSGALRMTVPTRVESIQMGRCLSDISVAASASLADYSAICGATKCYSGGATVLSMTGIRLSTAADDASTLVTDTAPLQWGPHIDFMKVQDLIRPSTDRSSYSPDLVRLSHLCYVSAFRSLAGRKTETQHVKQYVVWLRRQLGTVDLNLALLDDEEVVEHAEQLGAKLADTECAPAAAAMLKVLRNIDDIFTGDVDVLEILREDETLTKLRDFTDQFDRSRFLRHLSHSKPNLRILEIGAGTGALTANMLQSLVLPDGQALYSSYCFTDVESSVFAAAKARLETAANMEYIALDINQDPAKQGFAGREFDLVIASNALHATPVLRDTLRHVRSLMAPDGRLLFSEMAPSHKWVNFIFGPLANWWSGADDGRVDEPYVRPERWNEELVAAGFSPLDAVVFDSPEPYCIGAAMVARTDVAATAQSPRDGGNADGDMLKPDFEYAIREREVNVGRD